mgnify:CR=1 FL=1
MQEHETALIRYTRTILKDESSARDAVQESFIKYLDFRSQSGTIDNPKSWLYRVAYREAINIQRKQKQQEKIQSVVRDHFQIVEPDQQKQSSPSNEASLKEIRQNFQKQLATFSPKEQKIINMKLNDGLSYKEIATATELSVSNVGAILHRSLKKLSKKMQEAL